MSTTSNPRPKLLDLLFSSSMDDHLETPNVGNVAVAKAKKLHQHICKLLRLLRMRRPPKKEEAAAVDGDDRRSSTTAGNEDFFELHVAVEGRPEADTGNEDVEVEANEEDEEEEEETALEEEVKELAEAKWHAARGGEGLQVATREILRWGVAYMRARTACKGLKRVGRKAKEGKVVVRKMVSWKDGKEEGEEGEIWRKRILMGQRCRRITYPCDDDGDSM